MGTQWRVQVDRGVCVASGMCATTAPEDFELDSVHQSHPRREVAAASDVIMEAAEGCPVEAISIEDAETGDPVFPPD